MNVLPILAAMFLIVAPNGSREKWITGNDQPPKANQVPAGSEIFPIPAGTKDEDLFFLQPNGSIVKPQPQAAVDYPLVSKMEEAIFQDETLPLYTKVELIKFFPLLERYSAEPAFLQPAWAAIKAVYAEAWLPAKEAEKVEAYAAEFHVPLVP